MQGVWVKSLVEAPTCHRLSGMAKNKISEHQFEKIHAVQCYSSIIYKSQDREQPKCPSRDERKKMWDTHTHNIIQKMNNIIQKNEILLFATAWAYLEGVMLSDIRHTKKQKYCMFSLICGI